MKNTPLIEFQDVSAQVSGKCVLQGVTFTICPKETHVIMGPNGAGKSSIAKLIAGDPSLEVTSGDILLHGESIKRLSPEERVQRGIFMSFQNPMELPGVKLVAFLKAIYQAKRKSQNLPPLSDEEASIQVTEVIDTYGGGSSFLDRDVNAGFSGGEKKRSEILQMAILDPKLAILDEIDAGLDIDALKAVAKAILAIQEKHDKATLLITHYKRLLEYIKPDKVHIMVNGQIVRSGDFHLVDEVEMMGYEGFV
jgi:Fe-S cluster assembly ATP-binding protein